MRDENVSVAAGDAIGIHYESSTSGGGISYERSDRTSTSGFTDNDLFSFINLAYYNSNLNVDSTITGSLNQNRRSAAIRVFIECETGK